MSLHDEPLLTRADEVELGALMAVGRDAAERLRAGERGRLLRRAVEDGERARDRFIKANLRLVWSLAHRHRLAGGMEVDDLVHEGVIGLMSAVDRFDHRKGFRFSTYATWWIRQAMDRAMPRYGHAITVPVHAYEQMRSEQRHDVPHSETGRAAAQALASRSIDGPTPESDRSLHEVLPGDAAQPEAEAERALMIEYVDGLLDRLPPHEAAVLRARFGIGHDRPLPWHKAARAAGVPDRLVQEAERAALDALRSIAAA